jgi:uncharacterized protein
MKLTALIVTMAIGVGVFAAPATADAELDQLRQAAEQGDVQAQNELGGRYFIGKGVPMDPAEAAKWLKLAAEQGHDGAQAVLAGMYYNGNGVPKDRVMAHMWANLSASKGDETFKKLRDALANMLTPDQLAEAERMAREWVAAHPEK